MISLVCGARSLNTYTNPSSLKLLLSNDLIVLLPLFKLISRLKIMGKNGFDRCLLAPRRKERKANFAKGFLIKFGIAQKRTYHHECTI